MLTIPLIALIVCLVVDLTLILVAKIGTVYAAYAAARSAVVWVPSGVSAGTAQDKVEAAAQNAITPFASSNTRHRPLKTPPPSGFVYYAAHKSYADEPAEFCARMSHVLQYELARLLGMDPSRRLRDRLARYRTLSVARV